MDKIKIALSLIFIFVLLITFGNSKNNNAEKEVKNEKKQLVAEKTLRVIDIPKEDTKVSLDNVFDGIVNYRESEDLKLAVVGDIMLGRSVNTRSIKNGDFGWAFKNIKDNLSEYDLVFANLETPLIDNCKNTDTGMIFCGGKEYAKALSKSGIKIVSLANNHILNQGIVGLNQTQKFLEAEGISYTGVSNPTIVELKNKKVAFLGFSDVECNSKYIECASKENISIDIDEAKKLGADFIVVMFHWGSEYTYKPTDSQKSYAKNAIDKGVNLVVGNHPHWYQPIEIYKDKVVMYSHGNFIFDQMWSTETREGLIGEYIIRNNHVIDVNFIPIYISDYGKVDIAPTLYKKKTLSNLEAISRQLK